MSSVTVAPPRGIVEADVSPDVVRATSEHFYRDLVLSMSNGAVAIRRDGTVAIFNAAAYRILGIRPDPTHIGRPFADVLGADHEFAPILDSAFDLNHLPSRAELRLEGSGTTIGFSVSRVLAEDGQVTGATLFFKDLTRVEQLEERERLRDRLAALGEMAAGIAHEVKNPLAGIQVMAGLLKRQVSSSPDAQAILTDIIHEAQTANRIVLHVLEFARPINLQTENISVPTVLRDAITKYEGLVSGEALVLESRFDSDMPAVQGDHTQLRQLITNLQVNAYEELERKGRVTITAAFSGCEIDRLTIDEPPDPKGWITIDVDDDGPGIPADVTERIFSPFFTTKPQGSGLGLAIVRRIVDAHEGRIDVTTSPAGGTRVEVTLPVPEERETV